MSLRNGFLFAVLSTLIFTSFVFASPNDDGNNRNNNNTGFSNNNGDNDNPLPPGGSGRGRGNSNNHGRSGSPDQGEVVRLQDEGHELSVSELKTTKKSDNSQSTNVGH